MTPSPTTLHITIGTYPSRSMSLDQDLRLLKAAVLYADRVELYSLTASMLLAVMKLAKVPVSEQIRLLEMVVSYIKEQNEAAEFIERMHTFKQLRAQRSKPKEALVLQRQIETAMEREWLRVRDIAERLANTAGFPAIARAIEAGVLELHAFPGLHTQGQVIDFMADCVALTSQSPPSADRKSQMTGRDDIILADFVRGVSSAVTDGKTFPLFDQETSSLVRAGVAEGLIVPTDSAVVRSRHSALAAHILGTLPLFESATMDHVIEIRHELERPLVRFRGAVVKFADSIRSSAWGSDFPSDANAVFMREVAPAILEIEDAIKSNSLIASIVRNLADRPVALPSGSAIGLALSKVSGLPAAIAASLGAGTAASVVIYDAHKAWRQKAIQTEQNAMYFYYRAARRLAK